MRRFLSAAAAVLVLKIVAAGGAAADFTLTILHVNDVHSRIEPVNKYNSTCRAGDNAAGRCFGGMARLKSAIDMRRAALTAAGGNVLALNAGDQFQGSLFYSTYKGAVAVELMNRIGFDAMALGNHEFDDGPQKLAVFAAKARFPLLFANTNLAREPLLKDRIKSHIVRQFGDDKVAIIGILAEDTGETSSPGDNVPFIRAESVLRKLVGQLQGDGVDKIIVLSHIGIFRDRQIAAAVDGIDVIVGGHSHSLLDTYPVAVAGPTGKPVYIVQAYAYTRYLGELAVTFDDKGEVKKAGGRLWELNAVVPEDAALVAYIKEKAAPLEKLKTKVIGIAEAPVDGSGKSCRTGECQMGNLVADAMLRRVAAQGISVAIANGGGLRASIDAGAITMGEVLSVLPFQNTLATFQLKGADIVAALENGVSQIETGAGRFPQVAGLTYTFDAKAPKGRRVSDVMVGVAGGTLQPIELEKTYGVVTNNYLRAGGDGYKVFKNNAMKAYDYGPNLEEVVADYIAALGGHYKPFTDGRIRAK